MSADSSCPFCRIVHGEEPRHIVYEDSNSVAFLDIHPSAVGHTLVVPRDHARNLFDINLESAAALMVSATSVARLLKKSLHADGLTMLQTNEEAGWQSVFHIHLHLVPRWDGDNLSEPWRKQTVDSQTLDDIRRRILEAT